MVVKNGRQNGNVHVCVQENMKEFDFGAEYAYQSELHGLEGRPCASGAQPIHHGPQWALLKFGQPVTAPKVPSSRMQTICVVALQIALSSEVLGS